MAQLPHFNYPFTFGRRGAGVVEQDTLDEVIVCVYAVLATEIGIRQEEPEFGVYDDTFRLGGVDLEAMGAAIDEWEPRADVLLEPDWLMLIERIRARTALQTSEVQT